MVVPSSLAAIAFAAAVLLTGCSAENNAAPPVTTVTPVSSPSVAASGPDADDPPGAVICRQLAQAITAGTLMDPGVADGIAQVASGADAPIADSAERLVTAYRKAVSEKGTDDEPDAVAAVSAAGADLAAVCADSGLDTVG